jgi:hypothetical protein
VVAEAAELLVVLAVQVAAAQVAQLLDNQALLEQPTLAVAVAVQTIQQQPQQAVQA